MTSLDLPPEPRPEQITGASLVAAHSDFFLLVLEGQTHPELSDDIVARVKNAAEYVSQTHGPFASDVADAGKAFNDHYHEGFGAAGLILSPTERSAINRRNVEGILWRAIQACSFSSEPIADRKFMIEAAAAFSQSPDYVFRAIKRAKQVLLRDQPNIKRQYGLNNRAIRRMTNESIESTGMRFG